MVVGIRTDGSAQNIGMFVNGADSGDQENQELDVVLRRLTGVQQIIPFVVGQRPVQVLARAVDPSKGLFMEQTGKVMFLRYRLHRVHDDLVMVDSYVGLFKDRRELELAGRHLIVPGLRGNAQLEEFFLHVVHVRRDSFLDAAKILVFQLLPFRGRRSDDGPAAEDEILTLEEVIRIDQEVLLFRSQRRIDPFHAFAAEKIHDAHGALADRLVRSQERGFLVEGLSGIGNEGRRNAQCRRYAVSPDKGGR